jgi:two-component system sensor histidine kinase YesM
MFDELDSLNLTFSTNFEISSTLKRILRSERFDFDDFEVLDTIQYFINAPSNARPYIHSIYVYVRNDAGWIITTSEGLTSIERFNDTGWYASYRDNSGGQMIWAERRSLNEYAFQKQPRDILTVYRRISVVGSDRDNGVIVLNIDVDRLTEMLNVLTEYETQLFLVFDEEGRFLMGSTVQGIDGAALAFDQLQSSSNLVHENVEYEVARLSSNKYDWTYCSLIPHDELFFLANRVRNVSLAFILVSAIAGLLLAFYLTKRNTQHINNLVQIVEAAEQGRSLPLIPAGKQDEYQYITYSILQTFINNEYLRTRLSERQLRLKTMELLALQSQMNPHFLFNTLETLNWKVMELGGKRSDVNVMIENLSSILKYSLEDPDQEITLKEELDHVRSYVAIQKMRYRDKFEFSWHCDRSLEELRVLRLLLQPLVENAIYHGIKPQEGRSAIRIDARTVDSRLEISVTDTGAGMSAQRLEEIRESLAIRETETPHIGLYNTNKRIRLAFGEDYGITIDSGEGRGTTVTVILPILR